MLYGCGRDNVYPDGERWGRQATAQRSCTLKQAVVDG